MNVKISASNSYFSSLFLLLLMRQLFLCQPAAAQNMSFPVREMSTKQYGSALSGGMVMNVANDARSTMLSMSSFGNQVKYKSNRTLVKLSIDHAATTVPSLPYMYKMIYRLDGCPSMTDAVYRFSVTDTLIIAYNPDSLTAYQDMQVKAYPNLYEAKFTLIGFYEISSGTPVPLAVPTPSQNFFIELAMQYQPYVKTNYLPADMALATNSSYDASKQALNIVWNPSLAVSPLGRVTPVQYELEWTYSDNYSASGGALAASAVDYNFKNNATRIITDSQAYTIPAVYPNGYIIYRVRMLRVDSNQYRYPIYGPWSAPAVSGKVNTLTNKINYYLLPAAHSGDSLNWNYTIHFAEAGKYKHVLGYFDGLLKNRQTITRFNTNPGQVLATENIYDFEGRPAITTLLAVINTTGFRYQTGVSTSSVTGLPYSPYDFDLKPAGCPDAAVIPPFAANALANRYYSTLNTDTAGVQKFVPQAGGYPLVHTRLSTGFADRVDKAGAPGNLLQVNQGHDIANEYTGADQPDLNSLFGINAGVSSFYTKTVTKDQNGQYSMLVKDYKGKQVASSLIGASVDTTSIAMMINDEIPPASKLKEDKLKDKSANITVGSRKIYNGSFYMDLASQVNIKYEYAFLPYTVCTDPYIGLTVKCNYDYSIHDNCGVEKLHQSGVLGTTGISLTATTPPAATSTDVVLDKGKHTLDKTLTIADGDMVTAVDSFLNYKPNCVRTENDFIRDAVERTPYPCEREDGCPGFKKYMMQELFTNAKYGKYRDVDARVSVIGGSDNPDINSIYDIPQSMPDGSVPAYRYQSACVKAALNALTITKGGVTYTGLGDTMISATDSRGVKRFYHGDEAVHLFKDVIYLGDDRYTIAEALLPLHPEYCKLNACFEDTLAERLKAMPNSAVAEQYGLFDLDMIVIKDVQLRNRMIAAPFNKTYIADSLKCIASGYIRMDTFAASLTYCTVNDKDIYTDALSFYRYGITNVYFETRAQKDDYFNKLRTLYLANREKYVSMARSGAPDNCMPCGGTARMKVIPSPLIKVTYTADGSIATGSDGPLAEYSDSMRIKILAALAGSGASLGDTATGRMLKDSALRYIHRIDSIQSRAAADSILGRLANCFSDTTDKNRFRDSLLALIGRGAVHNGHFMPEQVQATLIAAGISQHDLCHPYLVSYDFYDEAPGKGNCYADDYYAAVTDFFNTPEIRYALQYAAETTSFYEMVWPVNNPFAQKVAASLFLGGMPAIHLAARHNDSNNTYTLLFARNFPDSVRFVFRGPDSLHVPYGSPISFNNVSCIYTDPAVTGEGDVARYMFYASIKQRFKYGPDSVELNSNYLSWNNAHVTMNEDAANKMASCITYTRFRAEFNAFAGMMTGYGGFAQDHPMFGRSLRNFMNFRLKRVYGQDQYDRFLVSSALADSMKIPMYGGYGRISFPATGYASFDEFTAALSASDDIDLNAVINEKNGSTETVIIDYNSIPYSKINLFNEKLLAAGGSLKATPSGVAGILWLPNGTAAAAVLAGTSFTLSAATAVQLRINPMLPGRTAYTRYNVLAGSATFAQVSRAIDAVSRNMYTAGIAGYWLPNSYATVNEDYYTPAKQQLLQYMYSLGNFQSIITYMEENYIRSNVPYLSNKAVTYDNPENPYRFTDLYYADPAATLPGFDTVKRIFTLAKSALGGNICLPATTYTMPVTGGIAPGSSLILYRCADNLYWYRYFGAGSQLYNVFLRVPKYVPVAQQPGLNLLGIRPGTGGAAGKSFTALMQLPGTTDTVFAAGSTDFNIAVNTKISDVLLGNETNYGPTGADVIPSGTFGSGANCEQKLLANNIYEGKIDFYNYFTSFRKDLLAGFRDHVMKQVGEKLWIQYINMRFGTTLYSYDLAGNLIQTVPPAGVKRIDTVTALMIDSLRDHKLKTPAAIPQHLKSSRYEYNTANQPVKEITPDAGVKMMFYDAKGNLLASQTRQQRNDGKTTYFLYDAQNRLTETGQVMWVDNCPYFDPRPLYQLTGPGQYTKTQSPSICGCENPVDSVWEYCGFYRNLASMYSDSLFNATIRSKPREQVVYTVYDAPYTDLSLQPGMSAQSNLRSRVAANMYYLSVAPGLPAAGYDHATHYSYDASGNVQTLTREFPQLDGMQQRYKRIDYEYDLLSGKVNAISYNRGYADQFYQRYSYDADNRITMAETSRDGLIWKRDAAYTYYQHGPLARVSIGDQRVQGMDYAYTLQGWLKSINGDLADTLADIGGDGKRINVTPKDAYATTIDYFTGDYQPIGNTPLSRLAASPKNLYNGNIARQSTDVANFGGLTAAYTYDQMNRIRKARYAPTELNRVLSFNNWYASAYRYDEDGNITSLTRRQGSGALMDTLVYAYPDAANNNKLADVLDYSGFSASGVEDLRQYTISGSSRMLYDQDGNTIKDLTSGTDTLLWNIYGKATAMENTGKGLKLGFGYDGLGQRTYKKQTILTDSGTLENSTFYVREASGNILAEYNTMRSLGKGGLVPVFDILRRWMTGTTGVIKSTWLSTLAGRGILGDATFSSFITSRAGSTSLRATGYYLAGDPGLTQQFISGGFGALRALCTYSAGGNGYPTADALRSSINGNTVSYTIQNICQATLAHPDPMVRQHALLQVAQEVPQLYQQIVQDNQLQINGPGDSANLFNLMFNISNFNPGYYPQQLTTYYQQDPASLDYWFNAVTADSLYIDDPWSQQSGYINLLQDALVQYGDYAANMAASMHGTDKSVEGFYGFSSWWPAGKGILTGIASPQTLTSVSYYNDPISFLDAMPDYSVMDSALSVTPGLDIIDLATGLGVDVVALGDPMVLVAPSVRRQEISLGSHHLYGSSRLGIDRYWPTQYRNSWDYTGGATKLNLGLPAPWYSSSYNDIIDTGKTDPYGNIIARATVAEHLLGQKQYELTNQLGNVQATVSDKRFVKIKGNDQRDYFSPAIVTAYDYYPYGMLMPGRFATDTALYCVTTTKTELIPRAVVTNADISRMYGCGTNYPLPAPGVLTQDCMSMEGSNGLSVTAGEPMSLSINFSYVYSGFVGVEIWEGAGPSVRNLASGLVNYPGSFTYFFTPKLPKIYVKVYYKASGGYFPGHVCTVSGISYEQMVYDPKNTLVQICNKTDDKYEFGLNGQMKMNEVAGVGNWNTAEFWEYSTRIGRRMNLDPKPQIKISDYSVMAGNPIANNDIKGDIVNVNYQGKDLNFKGGQFYNADGSLYSGKGVGKDGEYKGYLGKVARSLTEMNESEESSSMLSELQNSKNIFTIMEGTKNEFVESNKNKAYAKAMATDPQYTARYEKQVATGVDFSGGSGGTVYFNPGDGFIWEQGGKRVNRPTITLAHEMFHGLDANRGLLDNRTHLGVRKSEWQAVYRENMMRMQLKLPLRTYYERSYDEETKRSSPSGPYLLNSLEQPILPEGYKP